MARRKGSVEEGRTDTEGVGDQDAEALEEIWVSATLESRCVRRVRFVRDERMERVSEVAGSRKDGGGGGLKSSLLSEAVLPCPESEVRDGRRELRAEVDERMEGARREGEEGDIVGAEGALRLDV